MAKHQGLKALGITGIQPLATLDRSGDPLDLNADFNVGGIEAEQENVPSAEPIPSADIS